jgi:hypothetical protein
MPAFGHKADWGRICLESSQTAATLLTFWLVAITPMIGWRLAHYRQMLVEISNVNAVQQQ